MKIIKYIWTKACEFYYERLCPTEVISPSELFEDDTPSKYHHILCALRYMVIEDYYGLPYGNTELYIKTGNFGSELDKNEDLDKFQKLIKSFEDMGYNERYAIYVDKGNNCFNGTHRLALCVWFGIEKVCIKKVGRRLKFDDVNTLIKRWNISEFDFLKIRDAYGRMQTQLRNAPIKRRG